MNFLTHILRRKALQIYRARTSVIAAFMAVVFFYTQLIGVPHLEAGFWADRQKSAQALKQNDAELGESSAMTESPTLLAQVPLAEPQLLQQSLSGNSSVVIRSLPNLALPPSVNELILPLQEPLKDWLESLPHDVMNIQALNVPQGWKPSQGMVFLVQDAHGNVEAQNSIASIIESLSNAGTPLLVGIEGSRGAFDFSSYRGLKDDNVRAAVAKSLMNEGWLTGPEYVGIASKNAPVFWGVEDAQPYIENVNAFKEASKLEKQAKALHTDLNARARKLEEAVFNPAIRELNGKMQDFHSEKLGLPEYMDYLAAAQGRKAVSSSAFPMLSRFMEAYGLEKSINQDVLESERKGLTKELTQRLPKETLKQLAAMSKAYKTKRATYGQFYAYLADVCKANGVSLKSRPEMERYIRYVMLTESIQGNGLFTELDAFEKARLNALVKTPLEAGLVQLNGDLRMMGTLLDFGITPEERSLFHDRRDAIHNLPARLEQLEKQANKPAAGNGTALSLAAMLAPFERFDDVVVARNTPLTENLVAKMRGSTEAYPLAVLVAGGFHTEGITEILKAKDVAFAVLEPQLRADLEGTGTEYLDAFRDQKTPLEKIFAGERLTVAVPSLPDVSTPLTIAPMQKPIVVHATFDTIATYLGQPGSLSNLIQLQPGADLGEQPFAGGAVLTDRNGPTGGPHTFDFSIRNDKGVDVPAGKIIVYPPNLSAPLVVANEVRVTVELGTERYVVSIIPKGVGSKGGKKNIGEVGHGIPFYAGLFAFGFLAMSMLTPPINLMNFVISGGFAGVLTLIAVFLFEINKGNGKNKDGQDPGSGLLNFSVALAFGVAAGLVLHRLYGMPTDIGEACIAFVIIAGSMLFPYWVMNQISYWLMNERLGDRRPTPPNLSQGNPGESPITKHFRSKKGWWERNDEGMAIPFFLVGGVAVVAALISQTTKIDQSILELGGMAAGFLVVGLLAGGRKGRMGLTKLKDENRLKGNFPALDVKDPARSITSTTKNEDEIVAKDFCNQLVRSIN
ncbi:MAG: hypothetical protein HY548_01485, partial [Elusimicrobia bacterium]|nr:hypothetical protein [Elusimicrobiota bacterium]